MCCSRYEKMPGAKHFQFFGEIFPNNSVQEICSSVWDKVLQQTQNWMDIVLHFSPFRSSSGTHQNSLLVALAHVNSASTAASTVAALTEKRHGSTASMNAATCGTPGGGCPNSSVADSVGV